MAKLDTMGFESKAIIDLVTSGEVGWQGFTAEKKQAPFDELEGNKCFVFGNGEEDEEYIKACGQLPLILIHTPSILLLPLCQLSFPPSLVRCEISQHMHDAE